MSRIHPSMASHKLNVMPFLHPIRQKVQHFHPNRQKIIQIEIDKLLVAGFIKKKDGKWRVCVDYTNLNDVCLKDSFLLPRIDQIVNSTTEHGMFSFLDAFSRYHQILMFQSNEEKITFVTLHGLETRAEHVQHLEETFRLMRGYNMKLNPTKCAFGVSTGKFLGFMNGADYSSLKKCHSEAPPILPSSSSDHTHKPATPSYPAQIGSIQMNVEMGHQVEVSRSEVGLILQSPTRELMEQAICLNFFAANNEVEYEVVLVRLDLDLVLAATKLEIRSDYQLIVKQIQREYEVNDEHVSLPHHGEKLPGKAGRNEKTNVLTEIATTLLIKEVVTLPIYLKAAPSITPELVSNTSQMDSGWMLNIVKYFQTGKWGMDIVRPLPIAAAQKDFLPVAIDYFNKWVEAKAYASIKDKDVSKFIRKNIICRFGVPRVIVTDNGPYNEQAESKNKTFLNAIKKKLEEQIGATPFALAYGMEVIILTKIGMPTTKTIVQDQMDNDEELIRQLDWADKLRGNATIQLASYHQMTIAQRVFENIADVGIEKLQYNWEGPYIVTKVEYLGAYHL
uniref:Integrase catalytic domain-containing protein n=1 Tax=Vitis vinifera TaxID=29760 RepID=A5ASV6_VITVI|nr:hypothetical protein VITISV_013811 [Vitis vinifera]